MGKRKDPVKEAQAEFAIAVGAFADEFTPDIIQRVQASLQRQNVDAAQVIESDVEEVLKQIRDDVAKHETYKAADELRKKNVVLKARFEGLDALAKKYEHVSFANVLLSAAGRIAFRMVQGTNKRAAIREVLTGLNTLVGGKSRKVYLGAAVRQLGLEQEPVALDDSTRLRSLTGEERLHAYRGALLWSTERNPSPGGPALILLGHKAKFDSIFAAAPRLDEQELAAIRSAVAFLQLYINKELLPERLFAINENWLPNPYGEVGRLSSSLQPYPDLAFWQLVEPLQPKVNASLASELREAWAKHRKALTDGRFKRAATRFSISLHRESSEDALVDSWVGLEALFGGGPAAIGVTVATKLAILLDTDMKMRKLYKEWITSHYSVRSAIVHGGDVSGRLRDFIARVNKAFKRSLSADLHTAKWFGQDWLRKALLRLADHPEVLDELDEVLLSGTLRCDLAKRLRDLPPLPRLLAASLSHKKKGQQG